MAPYNTSEIVKFKDLKFQLTFSHLRILFKYMSGLNTKIDFREAT